MQGCWTTLAFTSLRGDGNVDDGEACDDGNTLMATIVPTAEVEVCGDGYVASSEACDDGNTD